MKKIVIILFLFFVSISVFAQDTSLAEGYLRRLGESSKKSRKNSSTVGFIGGGICLGIGAAVISAADEKDGLDSFGEGFAGAMLMAVGVVGVVGGAVILAIPSPAERKLKKVIRISDPAQRERASHEALSSLATSAKIWRIVTSAVFAVSAVSSLTEENGSFFSAAAIGSLAAATLLTKTRAERTYQNYLKEKEYGKKLALRISIMPYGGVKIDLAFSF